LTSIKIKLGERYDEFFADEHEDANRSQLVDLPELDNYFDLFGRFEDIERWTQRKSELCKCAALHSQIVDRAILGGDGEYDRCAIF